MNDPSDPLYVPEGQPEEQPDSGNRRAWMTPVLAVVMLAGGLFLGYFGRPYVQTILQPTAEATQQAELPSANPPPASGEPTPTLMEFLISNTRHFKGDQDAPVTMIEFSDYQ
jgi:hypothetical protein